MTNKPSLQVLVAEIQQAKTDYARINKEIAQLTKERIQLQKLIHSIERKMKNAEPAELVFSEHAMLRYIERELGINTTAYKMAQVTPELIDKAKKSKGDGKIEHNEMIFIIKNYVIVSVYHKNKKDGEE